MSTLLSDSPVALPHTTFTGSERPHHSLFQDMFPEQKASQEKCWPSGPNTDRAYTGGRGMVCPAGLSPGAMPAVAPGLPPHHHLNPDGVKSFQLVGEQILGTVLKLSPLAGAGETLPPFIHSLLALFQRKRQL